MHLIDPLDLIGLLDLIDLVDLVDLIDLLGLVDLVLVGSGSILESVLQPILRKLVRERGAREAGGERVSGQYLRFAFEHEPKLQWISQGIRWFSV